MHKEIQIIEYCVLYNILKTNKEDLVSKKLLLVLIATIMVFCLFADGTDTSANAPSVIQLPYSDTGDLSDNTNDNSLRGRDEWWRLTPTINLTNLDIHPVYDGWDGYLYIYDSALTEITHNDDGPAGTSDSQVVMDVSAGQTIYICIDEYTASTDARTFTLNISADQTGTIFDENAPETISNAIPTIGAVEVALMPTLTWDFGANTETYDLLIDTINPPVNQVVTGSVAGTSGSYTLQDELTELTTYYWQVVSHNSATTVAIASNMNFTTVDMSSGHIENADPTNGSLNIPLNQVITWEFASNTETYDLFFDTVNPPVNQVVTDGTVTGQGTYEPPTLDLGTTYFWKVVSKNSFSIRDTEDSFTFQTTLGEDTIVIGNEELINMHLPIEPYYGYSYTQTIYQQNEVNVEGRRIERISYHYNQNATLANCNEWVIYMGHTVNTSFADTDSWIPIDQLVEVYNGSLPTIQADGWIEFVLTTPFIYNNTDNLVIAVEENEPQYGDTNDEFFCSTVADTRSIYYHNDSTNPDPNAPLTASGIIANIPNTRLEFGDIPATQLMYNPESYDYGILYTNTASEPFSFTMQNTGSGVLNIQSVVLDDQVNYTLTDNNNYPLTLNTAESANFSVAFNPINEGALPATVTITDDIARQAYVINLTGQGFNATVSSFPYIMDFDAESTLPIGWEQGTEDDSDWTIGTSTPSSDTGAQSGDHTSGTGNFIFTEASLNTNQRFDLLSPPVDVTSLSEPFCSFWYNMYGSTMGSLHIDIWDGTQWNEDVVTEVSGDQGQDWHSMDVPLSDYTDVVQIRFRGLTGEDYYSDICIDDITFWDNSVVPNATTLVSPTDGETGVALTDSLLWNAAIGVNGYYVSLGTDNPPTDIFNMQDVGSLTVIDYPALSAGVQYYWQVIPYNAIGNAVNCPVWSFTTFNDVPLATTLVAPLDASEFLSITPHFEWDPATNYPDGYKISLGTDNPPTDVLDNVDVGLATSYDVATTLEYETTYYWQITPYNFVGDAVNCPVWSLITRPEGMVIVGDGTEINQHLPIEPFYGYTYSQSIYTAEEMESAGFINSISYNYNGTGVLEESVDWVIYMGTTTNDSYVDGDSWIPIEDLTMVYNATITPPDGAGWIDFPLDNMFFYDGMSNLVIAVEENMSGYGDSDEEFYCTTVTDTKSILYYSDTTNPDPNAPPTGTVSSVIPNTRFFMIPPSDGPYVIISALNVDFGVENVGSTSVAYNIRIANFGNQDAVIDPAIVLGGDNADQFSLSDDNTYPINIPQFGEVDFDIYFAPTSEGHKQAMLTIVDNVTEDREIHEIPLHGYAYTADNNESSDDAIEIALDCVDYVAVIEPEADVDWYVFWQAAPANLEIHTENIEGSTIDLTAFLYGPYNDLGANVDEFTSFAFDDDSWSDSMNPYIDADITESGFYYLRISRFDNVPVSERAVKKNGRTSRWATGDYALFVTTDNHEPPVGFDPPTSLDYNITYQGVELSWTGPSIATRDLVGYNVYRDDVVINSETVPTYFYLDQDVVLNQTYEYKVTALYSGPTGESPACDSIMVTFIGVDPPVIAEDFEGYEDFATEMQYWTLLDVDGEDTFGFTNGINFPGETDPMSFIVFNPSGTVPPLQFADAYSGDRYGACFSADSGSNDDWMITPKIQMSNEVATLSFKARSYTTQFGPEQLKVLVSSGSTNPSDFTVISGDNPLDLPLEWTNFEIDLSDYQEELIRVAFNCVSEQTFFMMIDDIQIMNDGAVLGGENPVVMPDRTSLCGNYPNPFNPETTISFDLKDNALVTIDIYNIKGQRVARVTDGDYNAGRHSIVWDGKDSNGTQVSSGVYFYKMNSGSYTRSKKMILMK